MFTASVGRSASVTLTTRRDASVKKSNPPTLPTLHESATLEMYRLPNGETTAIQDLYISTWRLFAARAVELAGGKLYGFDPDIAIMVPDKQLLELPAWFVSKLNAKLEGDEHEDVAIRPDQSRTWTPSAQKQRTEVSHIQNAKPHKQPKARRRNSTTKRD